MNIHELTKTVAGHIEKPLTLQELCDTIERNEYSAEMMLQHALILLSESIKAEQSAIDSLRKEWQSQWDKKHTIRDMAMEIATLANS